MNKIKPHTGIMSLFLIALLISVMIVPGGCSSIPKQTQIVITYQSMGIALEEAKPAILALCASGVLNETDCAEAKAAYNQAVTIYKTLGTMSNIAIDTDDDTGFRSLALKLQSMLVVINKFLVTQ
jgi:hypothetical protein